MSRLKMQNHEGPAIRFTRPIVGDDDIDADDVREMLDRTIRALQEQLVQAITFAVRFNDGRLTDGDKFLDYSIVQDEGYDRTGPSEIIVEEI